MGWGSGSGLMLEIIEEFNRELSESNPFIKREAAHDLRHDIYMCLIERFLGHDCDTLCECLGLDPAFDEAFECLDQNN
jgi:hypothetical protein